MSLVANCRRFGPLRRAVMIVALLSSLFLSFAHSGFAACANTTVPSGNITYAYDVNGRLTGVVNGSGKAAAYAYDALGNVTSIANPTAAVTLLGVSLNTT